MCPPLTRQFLLKDHTGISVESPSVIFKKMGLLVVESNARRILLTYLDGQDFYKVSSDVLFFRKKLERFILLLAKTVAIHRNHDYVDTYDMKIALVLYFHLITAQDITHFLNLEKIDTTKLFILHQLPLFSFYRNLIRRKLSKEAQEYQADLRDKLWRLLENLNELKKRQRKEILEDYINALEIIAYLQEKNNPKIILTKRLFEKSQIFLKRLLFNREILIEIKTLFNLYRLLKNAQLLLNLCLIKIPWEIQEFFKSTSYYKTDLRIAKILKRKNFQGLDYNRHILSNFLQFLSMLYALKHNVYINKELLEAVFRLFDKIIQTPKLEQIEYIQITILSEFDDQAETQRQDFLFTAFKKDSTKEAKEYILHLRKWLSFLLEKHIGRKELLLNHPKFVIQLMTALVFLTYRNAYFSRHPKIELVDVKMGFNQLCYLLLDSKFSYVS
ncbi:MAG: hypothetical protein ACTSRS_06980 [Candidatus Helarchaeota archaeon]